jgi:nucleotide-binding universal stress UspA family protein
MQEFKRILVPVDGSIESKKAAEKGIHLSMLLGIDIMAIHVIDNSHSWALSVQILKELDNLKRKQAYSYLSEIEELGKVKGIEVKKKILGGVPYDAIIKEVQKGDLIIMGVKGKTNVSRALMGSVSEKVVRHSPCSVMIVKSGE